MHPTPSAKRDALTIIRQMPQHATMDEVIDALWTWSMARPAGTETCTTAANRLLAVNPAKLVMANRAAREVAILGLSQQAALDAVEALPEDAPIDDFLVAVATWDWPEED